jgi:hypothetical protein
MKKKTYYSEKFKVFVRTLPCAVGMGIGLLCQGDIVPHHSESGGGISMKATDLSCVPLCAKHHQLLHSTGVVTFENFHSVDMWRVNRDVMRVYIERMESSN